MASRRNHGWLFVLPLLVGVGTVVAPSHSSEEGDKEVHGQVLAAGEPLAGARVRFRGQAACALTDGQGRFRLADPGKPGLRLAVAKDGYAIAAFALDRSPLTLSLQPLAKKDNIDYSWVDPAPSKTSTGNCGNCHADIYREWAGSSHARAATNPRFRNLYEGTDANGQKNKGWSLLGEHPLGAGVCAVCHAPTFHPARFEDDLRQVQGVAAKGVHCDYCHKVVEAPVGKQGITFGRDGMRLLRPENKEQLFFGPLDDADRPGESFAYSPLYQKSSYCASCHEGVVFGVHAYSTYSEYLDSPAKKEGKECQHCHMAPTGKMTNIAPGKGGIERDPRTLAGHHFPGNQLEQLQGCLSLAVKLTVAEKDLRAEVEVKAINVGHRVPTGFPDRQLLLAVEALDAAGKTMKAQAGPKLPASTGPELAGQPGKLFAKLLVDPEGRGPVPFWRPQGDGTDTRLVPGRPDHGMFVFPREGKSVRVRLVYSRFWHEVAQTKRWQDNDVVLVDRTLAVPKTGELIWKNR